MAEAHIAATAGDNGLAPPARASAGRATHLHDGCSRWSTGLHPRRLPSAIAPAVWVWLLCWSWGLGAFAQNLPYPIYAGEEGNVYRLLALDAGRSGIHAAMQPLTYTDVGRLLDTVTSLGLLRGGVGARNRLATRTRLGLERDTERSSWGTRGWRRALYRTRGHLLDLGRPGFRLLVNPVLDVVNGRQSDGGGYYFLNTRGVTLRGEVDDRVWFQTSIYENQARLPSYERDWRAAYRGQVPGVGFFKGYETLLYDDLPGAVDFFQATGELGFRLTRHIGLRLGHGNPRLGVGQRSMLLSDFADPYLYAQIDTRVWRLHYRNLYTQLQNPIVGGAGLTQRKHMVAHTLSVQLAPRWEFGLTEQAVFRRDNGFDAQYLNPIILYRAVEQDNGSPDNALIGFHSNVTAWGSLFYGQFLFDEFKFDELFLERRGWWANKWAWQLGVRSFDPFGLTGLDLVAEVNVARPFTYGHREDGISYTHYNQPLAHPWGASLRELRLELTQRVGDHWRLGARQVVLAQDAPSAEYVDNIGSNPLLDYQDRPTDYGWEINGTDPTRRLLSTATIQWIPVPGASVDLRYEFYATSSVAEPVRQHGISLGLWLNAIRRDGVF